MERFSDEALVLSTIDFGEADRIVTLFTRAHGRLSAFAAGARDAARPLGLGRGLAAGAAAAPELEGAELEDAELEGAGERAGERAEAGEEAGRGMVDSHSVDPDNHRIS